MRVGSVEVRYPVPDLVVASCLRISLLYADCRGEAFNYPRRGTPVLLLESGMPSTAGRALETFYHLFDIIPSLVP